jgi:hypothetical protein
MRICVDLTVWIQDEYVQRAARPASAAARIIDAVKRRDWNGTPLQLVISVQMLDRLRHILTSYRGVEASRADLYVEAIEDLTRTGPERLNPHLLLAGRERFPLRDSEDGGIFAVAMTSRVDLLVTANLRDFFTEDCEAIEAQKTAGRGGTRDLHVQIHRRPDGGAMILADPVDVVSWLDDRMEVTADAVRTRYAGHRQLRENPRDGSIRPIR